MHSRVAVDTDDEANEDVSGSKCEECFIKLSNMSF